MPPPKRKSPDRRKQVREPGITARLAMALARGMLAAACRHPRALFAMASIGVVFSFVATNALWYQPGGHPHPFLATRHPSDMNGIPGARSMQRTAQDDVTTFRIAREVPRAPAALPSNEAAVPLMQTAAPQSAPMALQQGAFESVASVLENAQTQVPLPQAAIPVPRPQEGPSPARSTSAAVAKPVAASRPLDPVAAAIRTAERGVAVTPPADIPNTGSTPLPSMTNSRSRVAISPPSSQTKEQSTASVMQASASSQLVLQIQRGLANIAYADVTVDGVAGSQTKAAIRRFERHYRLPETGEPNDMVLRKLKSIGAL